LDNEEKQVTLGTRHSTKRNKA